MIYTFVTWLFISCDASCVTLARFDTLADCEAARAEAVDKIPSGMYRARTGCIKAKVQSGS